MVLTYVDVFGDGERKFVEARITVDHPASSYGQPVVVLSNGDVLDYETATLLNYEVVKLGMREADLLSKWKGYSRMFLYSGDV